MEITVGNIIRTAYLEGIGWRLRIDISAADAEALDKAIDAAKIIIMPDVDAPGIDLWNEGR